MWYCLKIDLIVKFGEASIDRRRRKILKVLDAENSVEAISQ